MREERIVLDRDPDFDYRFINAVITQVKFFDVKENDNE